ncbi:hypothetical protein [Sabulicella glaciei]|uniref:DUF3618 domain-containing protein n=1 Tax=Sabulicella glaciei TaxID=2984948 RepID=A0ABT3P1F3_9PROT|nr:hypothetical protein [Roseococcus sp. MDT2-1-1]MCW8088221.1 hypothetical protein [Roseococcus sp. MDT2-1-1]
METPLSTTTDIPERLNLAELVSRIERQQEETRKFVAEQHKLTAEAAKLSAEASNLRVTRFVTPVAAVVAAIGALTAAAPVIARWLGGGG